MKNLLLFNYTLLVGLLIIVIAVVGGVFLSIKLNKKVSNNANKVDWTKFSASSSKRFYDYSKTWH